MHDTRTTAVDLLRGLSAADLRERLRALDAERQATMTLLRAAIRMERGTASRREGSRG